MTTNNYNPFDDEAIDAKEQEHQEWLAKMAEKLDNYKAPEGAERVPLDELVKNPQLLGL